MSYENLIMFDFKVGDYVVHLRNSAKKGIVTKIIEQYWDDSKSPFNRMPNNYEVTWEDKTQTLESQWTIDPCPFEPNELLKCLIV